MEELQVLEAADDKKIAKQQIAAVDKTEVVKANKTSVLKAPRKFHIVAGCFSSKDNAMNLVQNLKSNGFEALDVDPVWNP